jgi:hypothetical protein
MKRTITGVLLLLLGTACNKDINAYQNEPKAYFYELTSAITPQVVIARNFSFATIDSTIMTDTQYIAVKIQGLASGNDRLFGAKVMADSSTAVEGVDYKLLPGTIKANQFTGLLPVILYRTPLLKTTTVHIRLLIADTADFKAGITEYNKFTLNWNDALIKPDNWDSRPGLSSYFGTYSLVKYKFIIATLHMSAWDFLIGRVYDPTKITGDQMSDYVAQLKSALKVYNSTHTPALTDEFGVLVTFP